jgi:competence protein ComEA
VVGGRTAASTRHVLPAREYDMDGVGEWRLIEPEETQPEARAAVEPVASTERVPRALVAAIAAFVVGAVALAIWATLPAGGVQVDAADGALDPRVQTGGTAPSYAPGSFVAAANLFSTTAPRIFIDVEGAVSAPGVHELPDGSRVGDAIAAAGGYGPTVDIAAASVQLNLAQKLTDGQQIHVPALGETAASATGAPASTVATSGSTGLIDLNHASADELDTLPGIGPVTAAKIIDARTQAPFATVDELQSRGVVGPSTFEKLRDLVTVTP